MKAKCGEVSSWTTQFEERQAWETTVKKRTLTLAMSNSQMRCISTNEGIDTRKIQANPWSGECSSNAVCSDSDSSSTSLPAERHPHHAKLTQTLDWNTFFYLEWNTK